MKLPLASPLLALLLGTSLCAESTRVITDMDGRKVVVPVDPKRIVCMHGVSSDRITMLGKGANLVLGLKPTPWAAHLYPELHNLRTVMPGSGGNTELILSLRPDLVLYSPNPGEAEKYRAAGLHTACGFSAQKRPRTLQAFQENFKQQVRFFGDLLGPAAKARSEVYCRYFDRKIGAILAITSRIPPSKRPTVYYGGRSGNLLSTQGRASVMDWMVQVAGGRYLPAAIDSNFAEANLEQVMAWNPDIILVSGWGNSPEGVRANPNWAAMRAVHSGRLSFIPTGVFPWEYASGESVLLAIHLAKLCHPDLFRSWDMIREMKSFYAEVYGKTLTDRDAERILQCLPPQ
nr:ABC transporter substrate-binding protein [uncultured Holophaga sp.]